MFLYKEYKRILSFRDLTEPLKTSGGLTTVVCFSSKIELYRSSPALLERQAEMNTSDLNHTLGNENNVNRDTL